MSPHAFESLEPRQLLTLTTVGSDGLVPGPSNIAFQDMAVSTGGDSIVATVEEAAKPKLTAIRYDSTGQQVGSPITLATPDNPFFEQNVAVSMDPAGDAVVAYAQNNDEVDAILISKDGQVGSPKVVDTSTGNEGSVFTLDVSMDSSGGFFAGWILNNGDTSTLHFRAFDSTGAAKAAAFQLPGNSSTGSYDDVSVASFADGSVRFCARRARRRRQLKHSLWPDRHDSAGGKFPFPIAAFQYRRHQAGSRALFRSFVYDRLRIRG